MNRNYQLIIFDIDGTLVDSVGFIAQCMQATARDLNLPALSESEIRYSIGLSMRQAVRTLYNIAPEPFVERYRYHYFHSNAAPLSLFDGVEEVLMNLTKQGYQLAVATSKGRPGLNKVLIDLKIKDYFLITRTADETQSKPHPQMLWEILEETKVSSKYAVMVGDSIYDMQMAQKANVSGLGVTYGVHNRQQLSEYQPINCIDTVRDLLNFF